MANPIVTLTTDFGTKDYAVASLKGALYNLIPQVTIVDISHQISPFNSIETAYIIENAYLNFPKGTIHIIGVDAEYSSFNKHLAVALNGHYFLGADNGIISLLSKNQELESAVELDLSNHTKKYNGILSSFIDAASKLIIKNDINLLGKPFKNLKQPVKLAPIISKNNNTITGNIVYIDNYGNAISDIKKDLIEKNSKGRKFEINVNGYIFTKIHNAYNELVTSNKVHKKRDGDRLVLFNSNNYLEIAIYRSNLDTVGGASSLLGITHQSRVVIDFFDA